MRKKRNAYRTFVEKYEGKRLLGGYIELYPKEMGWVSMDWINVAQGTYKWGVSCEHHNEPQVFTKCCYF
jgi:hypothetical protein